MKVKQYLICFLTLCITLFFTACGTTKVEISPETLELLRTQYASGSLVVDYSTAEEFEAALNSGIDVLEKTVTCKIRQVEPESAVGFNAISGEHLNFASVAPVEVEVNDEMTMAVTSVSTLAGSWIIHYELIGLAEADDNKAEVEATEVETEKKVTAENVTPEVEATKEESSSPSEEAAPKDEIDTSEKNPETINEGSDETPDQVQKEASSDTVVVTPVETSPDGDSGSRSSAGESTSSSSSGSGDSVEAVAQESAPAPVSSVESGGKLVWISEDGNRYHRTSTCSGMDSPWQVTVEEAESLGRTPCKRCNP